MKRKLGKLLAGITILVATILGSMGALPAHAGNYGQQLYFYDTHPQYTFVDIKGYNQYGQLTDQVFQLNYGSYTPDSYYYDSNWWWQGAVVIYYYDAQWDRVGYNVIWVPVYQANSDWYYVSA